MAYSPPVIAPASSAPDLPAAQRTLAVYRTRLDRIIDASLDVADLGVDDPAYGSRCAHGDPDRPGSGWLDCPACPMQPDHGSMAAAANSLCRGLAAWWRQRLLVAQLAGDSAVAAECEAALAPRPARQDSILAGSPAELAGSPGPVADRAPGAMPGGAA